MGRHFYIANGAKLVLSNFAVSGNRAPQGGAGYILLNGGNTLTLTATSTLWQSPHPCPPRQRLHLRPQLATATDGGAFYLKRRTNFTVAGDAVFFNNSAARNGARFSASATSRRLAVRACRSSATGRAPILPPPAGDRAGPYLSISSAGVQSTARWPWNCRTPRLTATRAAARRRRLGGSACRNAPGSMLEYEWCDDYGYCSSSPSTPPGGSGPERLPSSRACASQYQPEPRQRRIRRGALRHQRRRGHSSSYFGNNKATTSRGYLRAIPGRRPADRVEHYFEGNAVLAARAAAFSLRARRA